MPTRTPYVRYRVVTDLPEGRPEYEENDCAVAALTRATGKPYLNVHAALWAAGRANGKGTHHEMTSRAADMLGFRLEPFRRSYYSYTPIYLGPFARSHAEGAWLVETGPHPHETGKPSWHLLAIVDGVVYETMVLDHEWGFDPDGELRVEGWRHARRTVNSAWRVVPL